MDPSSLENDMSSKSIHLYDQLKADFFLPVDFKKKWRDAAASAAEASANAYPSRT